MKTEHQEQVQLVRWFRASHPSVLIFAIPNGGYRSRVTASRLKAEGVVRWDANDVAPEHQEVGCEAHVLHPDLVPWPIKDSNHPDEAVYDINGTDVRNGEPGDNTFSSAELIASNGDVAHDIVIEARKVFPGSRITGVIETDEDGASGASAASPVVQSEPS